MTEALHAAWGAALAEAYDPNVLDALAAFHRALARAAEARAIRLRADAARRRAVDARLAQLERADTRALTLAQRTGDDAAAVALVAAETGLDPECVRSRLARRQRDRRAADKASRDRKIRHLASRGWSDPEIAAHVSLSVSQVRRIIAARPRNLTHATAADPGAAAPAARIGAAERAPFLQALPDIVASYARSMSLERAVAATARVTGVPERTITANMKIRASKDAYRATCARAQNGEPGSPPGIQAVSREGCG